MAQEHEYICNNCGEPTKRSMLTVKKVLFTSMGAGSKTTRARVKAWLCPSCTKTDADWNLPKNRQPSERVAPRPTAPVEPELLETDWPALVGAVRNCLVLVACVCML